MSDETQLTPDEQELETALRSLRPTPARAKPPAVGRLAALDRSRRWQLAAAAAVTLAAGGAWLALGSSEPAPLRINPEIATTDPVAEPPTLLVYRRALAESPAALNAMLDRHAATHRTMNDRHTPVRALRFWNPDLPPSLGEM